MKGTLADLKLAEELYNQKRPNDALKVIDRVLELAPDADTDRIVRVVESALHHTESDVVDRITQTNQLPDDMVEIIFSPAKIPMGGVFVPDLMLLRAKCYTDVLFNVRTKAILAQAIANSGAIAELFSGDADLLTVASQPFAMVGMNDQAAAFLGRALACDPNSRLLNATITTLRHDGWHHDLAAEQGFSPPPRLLRDSGPTTPAEMIGPTIPRPPLRAATTAPPAARARSNIRMVAIILVLAVLAIVIVLLRNR